MNIFEENVRGFYNETDEEETGGGVLGGSDDEEEEVAGPKGGDVEEQYE